MRSLEIAFSMIPLLVSGNALGEMIVELDLDGQFGNGPDSIVVAPQDLISVDLWLAGDDLGPEFFGFGVFVVDNAPLGYVGGESLMPPWWVDSLSASGDTVCVLGMNVLFSGSPAPKFLVARLTYEPEEVGALGELGIDLTRSAYAIDFGPERYFDDFVGAKVWIGGTTEAGTRS